VSSSASTLCCEALNYISSIVCLLAYLDYVYTGPVPNGSKCLSGSDRLSVYTEPFWNRSRTDPNGSKTGPVVLRVSVVNPFGSVPDRF